MRPSYDSHGLFIISQQSVWHPLFPSIFRERRARVQMGRGREKNDGNVTEKSNWPGAIISLIQY